jgi:hypothetical protein
MKCRESNVVVEANGVSAACECLMVGIVAKHGAERQLRHQPWRKVAISGRCKVFKVVAAISSAPGKTSLSVGLTGSSFISS